MYKYTYIYIYKHNHTHIHIHVHICTITSYTHIVTTMSHYMRYNNNIIIIQCRWFPEVQNVFYNGNKRKQIPLAQLDQFFESSAVLMTNLLRELALNSILEYEQVFCPPEVHVCVYTYILYFKQYINNIKQVFCLQVLTHNHDYYFL